MCPKTMHLYMSLIKSDNLNRNLVIILIGLDISTKKQREIHEISMKE